MDKMLPGLLALGDDIDAGVFLQFHRQHGGVTLGALKLGALGFPGRPQHVGLGQPFRFRQRAGDRGWKQHERPLRFDLGVYLPCTESGVHIFRSCPGLSRASTSFLFCVAKTWMAGTGPAMTISMSPIML